MVDGHEDGRAQLNGLQRVVKRADGQSPAANAARLLKDCDVDFDVCFICVLSQVVGSRRPGSSSSCGIKLVGCRASRSTLPASFILSPSLSPNPHSLNLGGSSFKEEKKSIAINQSQLTDDGNVFHSL